MMTIDEKQPTTEEREALCLTTWETPGQLMRIHTCHEHKRGRCHCFCGEIRPVSEREG